MENMAYQNVIRLKWIHFLFLFWFTYPLRSEDPNNIHQQLFIVDIEKKLFTYQLRSEDQNIDVSRYMTYN
jgi:hypothetical protein